jgi:hypothetical protein
MDLKKQQKSEIIEGKLTRQKSRDKQGQGEGKYLEKGEIIRYT